MCGRRMRRWAGEVLRSCGERLGAYLGEPEERLSERPIRPAPARLIIGGAVLGSNEWRRDECALADASPGRGLNTLEAPR